MEKREKREVKKKQRNKKRPDVDKFYVTVLRRSFVCVKIAHLGSLSFSLKANIELTFSLYKIY